MNPMLRNTVHGTFRAINSIADSSAGDNISLIANDYTLTIKTINYSGSSWVSLCTYDELNNNDVLILGIDGNGYYGYHTLDLRPYKTANCIAGAIPCDSKVVILTNKAAGGPVTLYFVPLFFTTMGIRINVAGNEVGYNYIPAFSCGAASESYSPVRLDNLKAYLGVKK